MNDRPSSSKTGNFGNSKFYNDIGFEDSFVQTVEKVSPGKERSMASSEYTSTERFSQVQQSPMVCYAIRLHNGEELRKSLLKFAQEKNLKAAFVVTCVGSAKSAKVRMANATANTESHYLLEVLNPMEIVSLEGTLSGGSGHLHVSLSDVAGKVIGGHLVELIIDTTAEIVIGECTALSFDRVYDNRTEFKELVVNSR